MKLWKILVATLIALLLVCAVAMAETHTHDWSEPVEQRVGNRYYIGDNKHAALYQTVQECVCGETKYSETYQKEGACEYETGDLVAPTCEEYGYTMDTCKYCGHVKKTLQKEPTGHNNKDTNKKIFNGDCKNPPLYAVVCKDCGKQIGDAWAGVTDTTAHVWKDVSKLGAVDCITGGWKSQECTVCGEYRDVKVEARGFHVWDYANTVIVAPTCKDKGYSIVKCIDCGFETKHDYVAEVGCNIKWTAGKKATCKADGFEGYGECQVCGQLYDFATGNEIKAIKVLYANQNAHEVMNGQWTEVIISCTNTTNYKVGKCAICGEDVYESIPATEHTYYTASQLMNGQVPSGKGGIENKPTCDEAGEGWVMCKVCGKQAVNVVLPALGHDWSPWEYSARATCTSAMTAERKCQRDGSCSNKKEYKANETIVVAPALGHNWIVKEGSSTATCEKEGVVTRICANCKAEEYNVVVPATGHTYEEKVTAATCENDGKVVKTCKVCGDKKTEKIPAAHGATKEVAGKAASCGVAGSVDLVCTVCGAKVGEKATAALSHEYTWVVVTKPSESGNGRNEYKCSICGDVAEVKTIKFSKYYYNNTITSFGPTTRELVGGSDWYRVTPVDLSVDGVYTYDLIASNRYVVGTVTITVNAGTLTVSYNAYGADVKDESLLIYASKADLAAGTAVTAPVGAAINVAETFGADTKVLVSLILTGDYDAAGKTLIDDSAVAAMIANID